MLGLAGGPHCAVMCSALQAGATRHADRRDTARAVAALQVGRLIGYSAAGAAVAASVAAFATLGSASSALRPVWIMLQAGALVFGLSLAWTGQVPAWLATLGRRPASVLSATPIRFVARIPATARAGIVGACWAAMPCGLLQSALLVAALADGAAQGAAVMACFALGSAASLWAVGSAWSRLRSAGIRFALLTIPVRLAGGLLAGASGFALVHGLGSALDRVLCL